MSDLTDFRRSMRADLARFVACAIAAVLLAGLVVLLSGCQQLTDLAARLQKLQPAAAEPATAQAQPIPPQAVPEPPRAALAYRNDLVRTSRAVWGMDAPVAVFAAQIHQESAWNHRAVSKVGAAGLAQFMPGTTKWIGTLDPQLAAREPYNPAWAMRALVFYDQWLFERAPARYEAFDRMWVALRGYNGGLGHWQAEAAASGAAKPTRLQVDKACGRARRSAAHCPENLGYPHRILQVLQPRYLRWGPGL